MQLTGKLAPHTVSISLIQTIVNNRRV